MQFKISSNSATTRKYPVVEQGMQTQSKRWKCGGKKSLEDREKAQ